MKKLFLRFVKEYFWLLIILALALSLRLYRLNSLPFNFHEDEVLSGYLGRFILQNGKDLYGNPWPLLYFNKFGDYYIILPIYLSGISTFIFGINEFATRFPAAFFGALVVFPVFILALWTFKNKTIALLSSFFISITPWHLVLSRSTTEGIIGITIFAFAIVFLLKSIRNYSLKSLTAGAILFFISYFIYHPFRLYTPLLFLSCFFIFPEIKKKRKFFISFILLTVFFFSLSYYISTTIWGRGRFIQTSIFSQLSGVTIRLNELQNDEGNNNILIARLFHNKVIGFGREFITQYLTYFSPIFLFINGWFKSRYFVPENGPLYLSFFILILSAIFFRKKENINKQYFIFLILLLFLSPLPAAFTVAESPNVHRTAFMLIPFSIIIAYGFDLISKIRIGKIFLAYFMVFILIAEFIFFWHQYSKHMDSYTALYRNDAKQLIAKFAINNENKYDEVVLPVEGAMPWYYLFYKKDFNKKYSERFRLDARIDRTNKIRYIDNSCPTTILQPKDYLSKKIIVVDRYDCLSIDKFRKVGEITGKDPKLTYKVYIPNP
jgi:4-amino-4-deoxy-L-arabinose transferase-like glycosyltransferase